MRINWALTLSLAIGSLFLRLGCCVNLGYDSFCFILLYFVFYFVLFGWYHLEVFSFVMRDRKGVYLERREDEDELGEIEEGEINQGILHEKNNVF